MANEAMRDEESRKVRWAARCPGPRSGEAAARERGEGAQSSAAAADELVTGIS